MQLSAYQLSASSHCTQLIKSWVVACAGHNLNSSRQSMRSVTQLLVPLKAQIGMCFVTLFRTSFITTQLGVLYQQSGSVMQQPQSYQPCKNSCLLGAGASQHTRQHISMTGWCMAY